MLRVLVTLAFIVALCLLRPWSPVPFFRLPGDFDWRLGRLHLFLPLTTCILISLAASLLFTCLARR